MIVAVDPSRQAEIQRLEPFPDVVLVHRRLNGLVQLRDNRGLGPVGQPPQRGQVRVQHGFAHGDVALSVGVQKMVRSDLGAAGVLFTLDTDTGFRDVVLINAGYGLGENVVRGTITPYDCFPAGLVTRECWHDPIGFGR
mgnify:CR=1 FL=1